VCVNILNRLVFYFKEDFTHDCTFKNKANIYTFETNQIYPKKRNVFMTISFYINGRMYVVPISRLVFVKTCKIRMFRRQKCTKENRILSHIYHYVYHQDTYTTQFISLVFSQLWMYVLSSRCLRA